ncbi:MAG: flippase-like domain-containing protein, partial [Deltaproteobacteria bacterium]|nr:flippase-like domain-containing protein [Deltaproteobacteria bacterium]
MKRRWATAVRAGVSLALIGYLLRKADLGTTVALLAGARWAEAVLALVLCVGVVVVSAWRWNVLLADGVPYRALLAVTFIGYFFNNFLPTNFGGDGVRILCVRSWIGGWGRAAASVLWDRIAGVGGLVGIGLGAYLLDFAGIRHTPMRWAYPALGLGFAG